MLKTLNNINLKNVLKIVILLNKTHRDFLNHLSLWNPWCFTGIYHSMQSFFCKSNFRISLTHLLECFSKTFQQIWTQIGWTSPAHSPLQVTHTYAGLDVARDSGWTVSKTCLIAWVVAQVVEQSSSDQRVGDLIPNPCNLHVHGEDTEPQIVIGFVVEWLLLLMDKWYYH